MTTEEMLARAKKLLLRGENTYHAERLAPLMVQKATTFCSLNKWCSQREALEIQWQGEEFHPSRKRASQRAKWEREHPTHNRFAIPSRSVLMERIAQRRGYRSMAEMAAAQYQTGRVSPTLYSLMSSADIAAMQTILGFVSLRGGTVRPYLQNL